MTVQALRGQRILITGASSGIGAAVAVDLGREGARVALLARRTDLLADVLAASLAAGADPLSRSWTVDLDDVDAAERSARNVWDAFGHLDGFVSNAAMIRRRHALDVGPDELEQHIRVNFLSPARMVLALAPSMIARGGGTVVVVGSVAGRIGAPGELSYVASKHALAGFTETLAVDTLGSGLRVRLLTLGAFDTDIWQPHGGEPTHYTGVKHPPVEAARAVVDVLTGQEDRYETFVPPQAADTVTRRFADVDAFVARAAMMTAPRP